MKPTDKRATIDARFPEAGVIDRAAEIIKQGGVVVFPTRGLYGLAADTLNSAAVERIFDLKGRDSSKPILVLIHHIRQLADLALWIDPLTRHLMDVFWPGRITFLLQAVEGLAEGLVSGQGKIGVRLAGHPVASALAKAAGGPITGTSANLSGQGGCFDIGKLDSKVVTAVDQILDAGPLLGGPGSTIIDATGKTPVIVRQGAICAAVIEKQWKAFTKPGRIAADL
ncbi:MAG: threonylcarbamoyl-AMP synthase [Desulfobacteraceae bacterium]|nr:threonylcarbamoyl-AMP synthase [Desulfobacteraceae bacterium]